MKIEDNAVISGLESLLPIETVELAVYLYGRDVGTKSFIHADPEVRLYYFNTADNVIKYYKQNRAL